MTHAIFAPSQNIISKCKSFSANFNFGYTPNQAKYYSTQCHWIRPFTSKIHFAVRISLQSKCSTFYLAESTSFLCSFSLILTNWPSIGTCNGKKAKKISQLNAIFAHQKCVLIGRTWCASCSLIFFLTLLEWSQFHCQHKIFPERSENISMISFLFRITKVG